MLTWRSSWWRRRASWGVPYAPAAMADDFLEGVLIGVFIADVCFSFDVDLLAELNDLFILTY